MELSLGKLPWYAQVGAFVVVSAAAMFGFWHFYVQDMQADIDARQGQLTTLRAEVAKGVATARRLPEFQSQVADLQHRLDSLRAVLPEQKDVAEILRRVQGLATQSNLHAPELSAAAGQAARRCTPSCRTSFRSKARTTTSAPSSTR